MNAKTFRLFSVCSKEGYLTITATVGKKGKVNVYDGFSTKELLDRTYKKSTIKYKEKKRLRSNDKGWVHNNIPSSIWWKTEIHHDWKRGGIMYLLDLEEHSRITRNERRHK